MFIFINWMNLKCNAAVYWEGLSDDSVKLIISCLFIIIIIFFLYYVMCMAGAVCEHVKRKQQKRG